MLVFAVVLVVAVGCGEGVPTVGQRVPIHFSSGVARLPVPLSSRRDPLVLAAGDRAVVFGGYRIDDSELVSLSDGVVFDLSTSKWSDMSGAPFTGAPYHPGARGRALPSSLSDNRVTGCRRTKTRQSVRGPTWRRSGICPRRMSGENFRMF